MANSTKQLLSMGILKFVNVAQSITAAMIARWDAAYSWGNHALYGYLTTANALALDGSNGPAKMRVKETLISYVFLATDDLVVCNSATPITITLLAATGSKRPCRISNVGVGLVTVEGDGADTINGELNQELDEGEAIQLCDYKANKWVWF